MSDKNDWTKKGFSTRAIHSGQPPEKVTGAVIPPIFQTSTYAQKAPGEHTGFEYSRTQNPTRFAFEECLASLESGTRAFAFASGMAATTTMLHALEDGAHVVCSDDVYGGTFRLFSKVLHQRNFSFSYEDLSNAKNLEKVIQKNTRLVWLETPSNPMLKLIDLEAIVKICSKKNILVCVDNTFASPYLQRPLELGVDVVMHSTTKYIGGHSDVVGGALIVKDKALGERLAFLQNAIGAVAAPFDSFLSLRGLKTLGVRMECHCENAQIIAEFLSKHKKVKSVIYPGLKNHPHHSLAKKQMKGFGGMISAHLNLDLKQTKNMLSKLKLFTLAESLGGVESLIEHPAIMTHASVPKETREKLGITDGFIRLSVGIEEAGDLMEDLSLALG